jgi:hypothetical protein
MWRVTDGASRLGCLLLLGLVTAGCSSRTSRYPVEGVLTIDGKPVPQGLQVVFAPEATDAEPCIGVTNDKGQYVMYFKPGMKGLPAGTYAVSIMSPSDGVSGTVNLPPELAGIAIPERYWRGRSTLTCVVPRGGTTYDIALKPE